MKSLISVIENLIMWIAEAITTFFMMIFEFIKNILE